MYGEGERGWQNHTGLILSSRCPEVALILIVWAAADYVFTHLATNNLSFESPAIMWLATSTSLFMRRRTWLEGYHVSSLSSHLCKQVTSASLDTPVTHPSGRSPMKRCELPMKRWEETDGENARNNCCGLTSQPYNSFKLVGYIIKNEFSSIAVQKTSKLQEHQRNCIQMAQMNSSVWLEGQLFKQFLLRWDFFPPSTSVLFFIINNSWPTICF